MLFAERKGFYVGSKHIRPFINANESAQVWFLWTDHDVIEVEADGILNTISGI